MPKIRVDAEPLTLSQEEIDRGFVMSAEFTMPLIRGMRVDSTEKSITRLTQPARLRRNLRDERGSDYHLKLTRFDTFRVMVPVILAEIDSPTE